MRRQRIGTTADGLADRNAIGLVTDNGPKATDPGRHQPPINALGIEGTSVGPHDLVRPRFAPVAGGMTGNVPNKAAGRGSAVIDGTGVLHVGSGPGTIGGPSKNFASVNGTKLRR